MSWVLLTADKEPDCPLFSTKPIFKALSSIVLLFSSDNVTQMRVFMGNLSSKTLKCHISLMIYVKPMYVIYHLLYITYVLKFTLLVGMDH